MSRLFHSRAKKSRPKVLIVSPWSLRPSAVGQQKRVGKPRVVFRAIPQFRKFLPSDRRIHQGLEVPHESLRDDTQENSLDSFSYGWYSVFREDLVLVVFEFPGVPNYGFYRIIRKHERERLLQQTKKSLGGQKTPTHFGIRRAYLCHPRFSRHDYR